MLNAVKAQLLSTAVYKAVDFADDVSHLDEDNVSESLPSAFISQGDTTFAKSAAHGWVAQQSTKTIDVLLLCETKQVEQRENELIEYCLGLVNADGFGPLQAVQAKTVRFTSHYCVRHLVFEYQIQLRQT